MSAACADAPLVQFLLSEIDNPPAETPEPAIAASLPPEDAATIRVPLEIHGALWSAEVERIESDHLRLIVDRKAIETLHADTEAAIRYQPDNGPIRRSSGRISAAGFLSRDRARLSFALR